MGEGDGGTRRAGSSERAVRNGAGQKSPALDPQAFPIQGAESKVVTERGQTIPVRWAVVESSSLVTSHDDALHVNPDYPAELQPRDRTRAASEQQITKISNAINPDLLGESPKAADGAPIIGVDKVVESGNARTIALRRAYARGKAEGYTAWLQEHAATFGIDPGGVAKPLLKVGELAPVSIGPGAIRPRAIAEGRPLYRETNLGGLDDLLRDDSQPQPWTGFVADNADLALGQGSNRGVSITFRADAVSGREHVKPGTGDLVGREYQADLLAPHAVAVITMAASDARKLRMLTKRRLEAFDRIDLSDGRVQFTRKESNGTGLAGMREPVLVRVAEGHDRAEFARQANESSVARMSAPEQALDHLAVEAPNTQLVDGYDSDMTPRYTSVGDLQASIAAEHAAAVQEAEAYEAGVNCFIRRGQSHAA
jgi:hypothetical protein